MRDIEFRAWCDIKKQYYIDSQISVNEDGVIKFYPENGTWLNTSYLAEQYTGLKDKNGVKIFEGDIVSSSFTTYQNYPNDETDDVTRVGVVKYYPSKGFVMTRTIQISNIDGSIKKNISPMNIIASSTVLIGNIHENKELLEDK